MVLMSQNYSQFTPATLGLMDIASQGYTYTRSSTNLKARRRHSNSPTHHYHLRTQPRPSSSTSTLTLSKAPCSRTSQPRLIKCDDVFSSLTPHQHMPYHYHFLSLSSPRLNTRGSCTSDSISQYHTLCRGAVSCSCSF